MKLTPRISVAALVLASAPFLALACRASSDDVAESESASPLTTGDAGDAGDAVLATARSRLASLGYEVQDGQFTYFDVCSCYGKQRCFTNDAGVYQCVADTSCAGNNPTSPYGEYALPGYPGQGASDAGLSTHWQLGPNEAVVFYGLTPPQASYFSFRSYDVTHVYPDGGTATVFASLGDSLNDRVISTMGNLDGGGSAFSAPTVVVTTGDQGVFQDVQTAFAQGASFSKLAVNADIINRNYSTMGIGAGADTFTELVRSAVPQDASASCAYQSSAPTALAVLRITKISNYDASVIDAGALRPRGSSGETAPLLGSLPALIQSYYASHGLVVSSPTDITATPNPSYGYSCIDTGNDCEGDNRDAVYSSVRAFPGGAPLTFEVGNGTFPNNGICGSGGLGCPVSLGADAAAAPAPTSFVVYGVNHAVTGESVYTNVTIYDEAMALGVVSVTGTSTGSPLTGSAARYLGNQAGATNYYAWRFARSCTLPDGVLDTECTEVPASFPGVATGATLSFTERAYLDPVTNTAPPISDGRAGVGIVEPHVLVLAQ